MTAKILVVDDLPINLRLMQARLNEEYFEVLLATSGAEAIAICKRETVDLVLLDIMMPVMDGYETCRRLKADMATRHIPVVLITALDQRSDRVAGLEAGADDFLTKPVRDLPLFSRVRSLTRLKMLTDELRVRAETTMKIMTGDDPLGHLVEAGLDGQILLVGDDLAEAERLARMMRGEHRAEVVLDPVSAIARLTAERFDLIVVDMRAPGFDPLRLCSQIRSNEETRQVPILLVAGEADERRVARALELGANDYVLRPVDRNELLARTRTQVKRRRYDDGLRRSVRETIELATIDALTGLFNRRFLGNHLPQAIRRASAERRPLSLMIADIDHFKRINDGWGHDAGDDVLRQFAARARDSLRASDLACRIGGEEFVILMPEADADGARSIAERLRELVAAETFLVGGESLSLTISVGCATLIEGDGDATLLKRADLALYEAKRGGRNRVVSMAA